MGGKTSRDKGARGELECIHMLNDNLGLALNRNYKQVAQAQHGDIEQLVGPFVIEIKNCKDITIPAWWRQAVAAAEKVGAIPCLAYKVARIGWKFIVPLPHGHGTEWGNELRFTQTVGPDGFYLIVREHLGA